MISNHMLIENGVLRGYSGNDAKVIIPDMVKRISERAFKDCLDQTEVVIPDTVTGIGFEAFSGCSKLEKIVIPKSVKIIGADAFSSLS